MGSKLLPILFLLLCLSGTAQEIKWLTFEEAIAQNETNPKPLFIDVYTDWCGWCKKMDATTFQEEKVIDFLNQFYCVKLKAEQRDSIQFMGKTYRFVANGNRGYHELAAMLLDGNLSYPTFAVLAPNLARLDLIKGFHDKHQLVSRLKGLKW
jgi:uncharacterized protein YyaL (SSP411 family)